MNKTIKIIISVLIILCLAMSLRNTIKMSDGKWTCIAQVCDEWAVQDDWIVENCRPDGEDKEMMCKIVIEGKEYHSPLKNINMSAVRSCKRYTCMTEVYVKGTLEDKKNE